MARIILVAVPGAGKSTILKFLTERRKDVQVVNYGDVMLEIAKARFGITNRDEMRKKIPLEQYREIQKEAAERIAQMQGHVVVDTHASIKIAGGYYPGLPHRIITLMKPHAIVLIEADPQVVLKRRAGDATRPTRDVETPEEVERHQEANRHYAYAACEAAECIVYIIDLRKVPETRPFEHAEYAAAKLSELIDALG